MPTIVMPLWAKWLCPCQQVTWFLGLGIKQSLSWVHWLGFAGCRSRPEIQANTKNQCLADFPHCVAGGLDPCALHSQVGRGLWPDAAGKVRAAQEHTCCQGFRRVPAHSAASQSSLKAFGGQPHRFAVQGTNLPSIDFTGLQVKGGPRHGYGKVPSSSCRFK